MQFQRFRMMGSSASAAMAGVGQLQFSWQPRSSGQSWSAAKADMLLRSAICSTAAISDKTDQVT
jgi:hypothetical protein